MRPRKNYFKAARLTEIYIYLYVVFRLSVSSSKCGYELGWHVPSVLFSAVELGFDNENVANQFALLVIGVFTEFGAAVRCDPMPSKFNSLELFGHTQPIYNQTNKIRASRRRLRQCPHDIWLFEAAVSNCTYPDNIPALEENISKQI